MAKHTAHAEGATQPKKKSNMVSSVSGKVKSTKKETVEVEPTAIHPRNLRKMREGKI